MFRLSFKPSSVYGSTFLSMFDVQMSLYYINNVKHQKHIRCVFDASPSKINWLLLIIVERSN